MAKLSLHRHLLIFLLLFGWFIIQVASKKQNSNVNLPTLTLSTSNIHINTTIKSLGNLFQLTSSLLHSFSQWPSKHLFVISKEIRSNLLAADCQQALDKISSAIGDRKTWAWKYIDSTGNILTPGQMTGSWGSLGNFDRCLNTGQNKDEVPSKYCLARVELPLTMTKQINDYQVDISDNTVDHTIKSLDLLRSQHGAVNHIGLCVPSVCRPQDVESLIDRIFYPIINLPVRVDENDCHDRNRPKVVELNKSQFRALWFFFAPIILLVLIATAIHLLLIIAGIKHQDLPLPMKLIHSFSAISNHRDLLSTSSNRLGSVDVIRTLITFQGVVFHVHMTIFVYQLYSPRYRNVVGLTSPVKRLAYSNLLLCFKYLTFNDIHILVSGLLFSLNLLVHLDKDRPVNLLRSFLQRWSRLAPSLTAVVLASLFGSLADDGRSLINNLVKPFVDNCCASTMLPDLLFCTNWYMLFQKSMTCCSWSWTISLIMQYQLLAPFLVTYLHRHPNKVVSFSILVLSITCLMSIIVFLFGVLPSIFISRWLPTEQLSGVSESQQSEFFVRFLPFYIGIIVGYLIQKRPKINLGGRIGEMFLWILTLAMTGAGFVWMRRYLQVETSARRFPLKIGDFQMAETYSTGELCLYTAFRPILYCSGFAFLMFMCITRRSAFLNLLMDRINSFLWPWNRLYLGIYLFHASVILMRVFRFKQFETLSEYKLFTWLSLDFVIITLVAYLIFIVFEAPGAKLGKLLFDSKQTKVKTTKLK